MKKSLAVVITLFSLPALQLSVAAAIPQPTAQPIKAESQTQSNAGALTASTDRRNGNGTGELSSDPEIEYQRQYEAAIALSEAGKLTEAIAAFKQILKSRPQDPESHFALGMTYHKAGSYKDSYEQFRKAVKYKPDWAEAQFRLGMTSHTLGKRDQMRDVYKKLVKLESPLAKIVYQAMTGEKGTAEPSELSPASSTSDEPKQLKSAAGTDGWLSEIYRIGVGDVLDIRFLSSANSRSTLFTVINGGVIDLPVAGGAVKVAGLTTDEISARIDSELRRRAVDRNPQVSVGVRQYASHQVVVTGLVVIPGTRFLRREAVPLYVVLAESQLRNDAGRVMILRAGTAGQTLDLSNPATLNTMLYSGDVVTVSGRQQEYYYIGGRIAYAGQKSYQSGITLLQAILAAGGTLRPNQYVVEISRDAQDGRLVTTKFNIKQIKDGTAEDPKILPGDRIEVMR